jgi:hypothetical protein
MADVASYQARIGGVALLLSVAAIAVGFAVIAAQGRMHGLTAGFRGVEGVGEAASALSTMAKAGLPSTLLQLAGFGILAVMLRDAGEGVLSTVSFGILIFASAVMVIRPTFEGTITVWAAQEWATTGAIPDLYQPLLDWVHGVFAIAYVSLLVAMLGFGWGALRAELLAPWVGWVSIGWSAIWIVGYVFGVGLPAIIIVFPLIYGIGLLLA